MELCVQSSSLVSVLLVVLELGLQTNVVSSLCVLCQYTHILTNVTGSMFGVLAMPYYWIMCMAQTEHAHTHTHTPHNTDKQYIDVSYHSILYTRMHITLLLRFEFVCGFYV